MSYRLLSGVFGDPGNGVPELFGSDGPDDPVESACTAPLPSPGVGSPRRRSSTPSTCS